MLPADRRLRQRRDIQRAVRGGVRVARPLLVVHLMAATAGDDGPARAGFVVSRAVGPAVTRNRVKRRLRHLAAQRLDGLPAGSRLVVRALPAAAGAPGAALARDLDAALAAGAARATRSRHGAPA